MEPVARLYNRDCIMCMSELIREGVQVDAIICDPPYNINYASWDKGFDISLAIDLCYDLLKPNGNLILFQGWSNVCYAKEILDKKFNIFNWIAWDRIKGRGSTKNLVSTREDILWYCKGENPTYNKMFSNTPKKTGGWELEMVNQIGLLLMYGMIFLRLSLGLRKEMVTLHKNHYN